MKVKMPSLCPFCKGEAFVKSNKGRSDFTLSHYPDKGVNCPARIAQNCETVEQGTSWWETRADGKDKDKDHSLCHITKNECAFACVCSLEREVFSGLLEKPSFLGEQPFICCACARSCKGDSDVTQHCTQFDGLDRD